MPNVTMRFPHRLSQEAALQRTKRLLEEVKKQYGNQISNLQENWQGNSGRFSFKFKGFNVSGTLAVRSSEVEFTAKLPVAAIPFKGRIERDIRKRAKSTLA